MKRYEPAAVAETFPAGEWQLPEFCGPNGGNCVEVNLGVAGMVGLRDSKLSAGPVLVFDDDEWTAFLASARAGQYDR
jgi:hypothetical protein